MSNLAAVPNETPIAGAVRQAPSRRMASVVFASSVGTIMEWYDFLIYGVASALIFNASFFPTFDPFTGTLAALGTFAAGFVARPVGGAIFGHFGDRIGRKAMLLTTMLLMAFGTFAIGLLPTYSQIGIWAPILLVTLRVVQGIGLGGEWGGASLMVLEHAGDKRRGLYGSFVQAGFPPGLILSSGVFSLTAAMLSQEDFQAWGWRIPFLLSILLLGIGWFVRVRVPESPIFEKLKNEGKVAKNPLFEAVFKHPKAFLLAIGLKISENAWVYILMVFLSFYATTTLGLPKSTYLNALMIAAFVEAITIPAFGWLSDVFGRRSLYFFGTLFTMAFAFPLFALLNTKDPQLIVLAVVFGLSFGHGTMFGIQSAWFPELFGTRVRYSGASIGFQVAAVFGGGCVPLIATVLAKYTGATTGISLMLMGLAVITFLCTIVAPETKNDSLVSK